MSEPLDDTGTGHPILRFLDALEAGLDQIADAPTWSLTGVESAAAVHRITSDLARLAELDTRVLNQVDTLGIPADGGFSSLTSWLATTTHLTGSAAAATTRLATALTSHEQTRDALAHGHIHTEQAIAVARAVDDLDPDHHADRDTAEKYLLGEAATFDATHLTRLGRRILETIDPERADQHEAELLARQEARAAKQTRFTMKSDGEGLVRGSFAIPEAQASMLGKALHGLSSAKHTRATAGAGSFDHTKPTPEKLGQAFVEYIERYPLDKLPQLGGMAATVVVTMSVETLQGGYQAAHLDTGVAVSPGQARRWACETGLVPAALGTNSHVLDLGRTARLHNTAQRLALIVEQQTCQHPTCDTAGTYCHVHHTTPWAAGGPTNTTDAVLLCPFHHHQAHNAGQSYPIRT